jgi:hypothetical protein
MTWLTVECFAAAFSRSQPVITGVNEMLNLSARVFMVRHSTTWYDWVSMGIFKFFLLKKYGYTRVVNGGTMYY